MGMKVLGQTAKEKVMGDLAMAVLLAIPVGLGVVALLSMDKV